MKKTNLLLALVSIGALCSCNNSKSSSTLSSLGSIESEHEVSSMASENTPIEIEDAIGRKINVLPGSYKKVVCIGAGALRLYSYVGEINKLAGVEDIDNESLSNRPKMFDGVARPYFIAYKDAFKTLPSCGVGGPNAQTAEAEKILSCDPDIIISEYGDIEKENALQEQVGVPVITLSYGSQGIFDSNLASSISLLGKIFNLEVKSNALNSFIASEKAKIEARVVNVQESDKKLTYICGLGNWGTTNHLQTAQNYATFNVANIKNAITGLAKDGIQAIEREKFVEVGEVADKIIFDSAAIKNIKNNDVAINDIKATKAWMSGEVYLQMAYNAYYTNVELALVNTWFNAKCVYPSLFEDIDMDAKTNEITKAFLGKELANEIKAYPNSFGGYQKINTATFLGD